jgi:hypothetical protein
MVGGNGPVNMFTQSDMTQTAVTLGENQGYSVGFSWDVHGGAVPGWSVDLRSQSTFTWTSGQSVGETNGSAHTMNVNLATSTVDCDEQIYIFEDTLFHTYVFQQPSGNNSCP